jgi:predicted lipase
MVFLMQELSDRVTKLETQLEDTRKLLADLSKDVKQLNNILENAKGAKWVVVTGFTTAAAIGAFVATYWSTIKKMWL